MREPFSLGALAQKSDVTWCQVYFSVVWVPTAAGEEAGKGTEHRCEAAGWLDQEH